MKRSEFMDGIKIVQVALRGTFERDFLAHLWNYYKSDEAKTWARACHILSGGKRPANQLVFRDFMAAVSDARNEQSDEQKRENAKGYKREGKTVHIGDVGAGIVKALEGKRWPARKKGDG